MNDQTQHDSLDDVMTIYHWVKVEYPDSKNVLKYASPSRLRQLERDYKAYVAKYLADANNAGADQMNRTTINCERNIESSRYVRRRQFPPQM
jgi:hypothetical protein